ncbi:MAG: hypothetical protein IPJ82_25600 [Lewinellaceae bacterium]|nr:hypothetical protein [Lewinellaceae bacterium]
MDQPAEIPIQKNDKKVIGAWVMYDWANSVYVLVITSAIFAAYYNQVTRLIGSGLLEMFGFAIVNTALRTPSIWGLPSAWWR